MFWGLYGPRDRVFFQNQGLKKTYKLETPGLSYGGNLLITPKITTNYREIFLDIANLYWEDFFKEIQNYHKLT